MDSFKPWNMTNNYQETATNNNRMMINPLCSLVADSTVQSPGNGQHGNGSDQNQNKLLRAGKVSIAASDTNSSVKNSTSKGLRKRFHFAKNFLHLKSSKSVVAKSEKSCADVENAILTHEFSKSDENLIRIQVPFSEVDTGACRESCISRVSVEYNPASEPVDNDYYEEIVGVRGGYNEKAVDVPEDFVRNQWICKRKWKTGNRCNKYPESIRSFQREDWINTQTIQSNKYSHENTSIQNYDLTDNNNRHSGISFKSQNTHHQMGAGCSGAACFSKSVAPIVVYPPLPKKSQNPAPIKSPHRIVLEAKCNSYSNLRDLHLFDSPSQGSSSIQEDNILHRRNYVSTTSPSHHTSLLDLPTSSAKIRSKTSPRPIASDSQSIRHSYTGGGGRFFKNFSGSVQNLVQLGRDKSRVKSASENNLAQISKEKLNRKTNSVLIDVERGSIGSQEKDAKSRGTLKRFFDLNLPKIKKNKDRRKM